MTIKLKNNNQLFARQHEIVLTHSFCGECVCLCLCVCFFVCYAEVCVCECFDVVAFVVIEQFHSVRLATLFSEYQNWKLCSIIIVLVECSSQQLINTHGQWTTVHIHKHIASHHRHRHRTCILWGIVIYQSKPLIALFIILNKGSDCLRPISGNMPAL